MTRSFQAGDTIGNYVLDAYVGAGSFGAVWRGHANGSDTPVAVKLLTGDLATGDSTVLRAEVEVLAGTAASRSPHVIKVLGGGTNPVPYIVMEFVEGDDLQSLLRRQGKLTLEKTIEI